MVELRGRPALEWVVAGVGLVMGVALVAAGQSYGLSSRSGVGPGIFPAIAGFFLTLSGAARLVTLVRCPAVQDGEAPPASTEAHGDDEAAEAESSAERRAGAVRVVTLVLAMGIAALLLPHLGFVFVMTAQLVVVLVVAGRQSWFRSLLVSLVVAVATRYVFGELLGVALPLSVLPVLAQWGI